MTFVPGPDGELPDDIAEKLGYEPEKPKRQPSLLSEYQKTLTVILLLAGASVLFICSLITTAHPPAFPTRAPVTLAGVTQAALVTIPATPNIFDKLPACKGMDVSRNGFIVLEVSVNSSNSDLVRANLAGEVPCRLTKTGTTEGSPAISPDGKTILYGAGGRYDHSLRLINVDGTDDHEISSFGGEPDPSPDGTQIVFAVPGIRAADILIARLDGTLVDEKNLVRDDYQREYNDVSPDWSPDGKQIAYLSDHETAGVGNGSLEVYTMNADGTEKRRLTFNDAVDLSPVWLPDGRIAFLQLISGEVSVEVFIMNADGSEQQQITSNRGIKAALAASPDGRYLYYTSFGDGMGRIALEEGYPVTELTANIAARALDVWTPR